jgi:subtilase family serine protease
MRPGTRAQKCAIVVGVIVLCLLLVRPQPAPAGPILLLTATASRTPTAIGTLRPHYLPLVKQSQETSTIDPLTSPDLVIDSMYMEMEGRTGSCVMEYTAYEIRVLVRNAGDAAAGSFAVQLNSTEQTVTAGLAAGQSVELHFSGAVMGSQYSAQIDPANQIAERDESNNTRTFTAPMPTAPVLCTPNPTTFTQPPDLVIAYMYLEMEGRTEQCMVAYAPYGIRVIVQNTGDAAAGPFAVQLNSAEQTVAAGLAAGQSIELHFAGTVPSGQYTAVVDPADQVAEHNESNNTQTFMAPTPSPPPICTPTPTGTPTPTPI